MSNGGFEQQGGAAGMPPALLNFFLKQLGINPEFGGAGGTIGLPNPQTGQGTFSGQPSPGAGGVLGTAAPTTGGKKQSAIRALTLIAVPVLRAFAAGQTGPRRGRNRQFLSSLLTGGAESIATEAARPRREALENLQALERIARIRATTAAGQVARTKAQTGPFKPGAPVKARTASGDDVFIQRNPKTGKLEAVPGFVPPGTKETGSRQIKARRNPDGSESLFIQKKPGSKEFEQVVIVGEGGQGAPATPGQQVAGFPAGARPAAGQQVTPAAAAAAPTPGGRRVPFVSAAKLEKATNVLTVDEATGHRVLVNTTTGKRTDTGILGRAPKDDTEAERVEFETTALRILKIARADLIEKGNADPDVDEISNNALDILEQRQRRRPEGGGSAARVRKIIRDLTRRRLGKKGLLQVLLEFERQAEL